MGTVKKHKNEATPNTAWHHYTIGRVVSNLTCKIGKDNSIHPTMFVELFGGLKVLALTNMQDVQKGMYVGVRIARSRGRQIIYTAFELNQSACNMIAEAADYIKSGNVAANVSDIDYDELPF